MTHKIIITPSRDNNGNSRHNSRGPQYDVTYEGGTIVTGSTQPLLDVCRVLKARGLGGPVEMWDKVLPYYRFRTDIDKAAGLTVREGDGLARLVRFESLAPGEITQAFSIAGGIQVAQNAECRPTESPGKSTGKLLAGLDA